MSEYFVSLPVIDSASISPNPVDINAKYTLSIKASEIEKILEPEIWYSGKIYSGEV